MDGWRVCSSGRMIKDAKLRVNLDSFKVDKFRLNNLIRYGLSNLVLVDL